MTSRTRILTTAEDPLLLEVENLSYLSWDEMVHQLREGLVVKIITRSREESL
jgi:hypothetical protein